MSAGNVEAITTFVRHFEQMDRPMIPAEDTGLDRRSLSALVAKRWIEISGNGRLYRPSGLGRRHVTGYAEQVDLRETIRRAEGRLEVIATPGRVAEAVVSATTAVEHRELLRQAIVLLIEGARVRLAPTQVSPATGRGPDLGEHRTSAGSAANPGTNGHAGSGSTGGTNGSLGGGASHANGAGASSVARPPAARQTRSQRWNAVAEAAGDPRQWTVHVPGQAEAKALAECTHEDLERIAAGYSREGERCTRMARRYEQLREALLQHEEETVGELPRELVEEVLR